MHRRHAPGIRILGCRIGTTFGVGLCEGHCKATPLFWRFRDASGLDVRGAAACRMAGGTGFGIREAVPYAAGSHIGLAGAPICLEWFLKSRFHIGRRFFATAVAAGSFIWFVWLCGRPDRIEARA